MSTTLALIDRIADNLPVHYIGCDRYEVHDFGCRQGTCDCDATQDVQMLIAQVRTLLEDRNHPYGNPATKGSGS